MPKKIRFVTKIQEPETEEVEVTLELKSDGVTLRVGHYYICTLQNDGELLLHSNIHHCGVKTDGGGTVIVIRERRES